MDVTKLLFSIVILIGFYSCNKSTLNEGISSDMQCIDELPFDYISIESLSNTSSKCTPDKIQKVEAFRYGNGEYKEYNSLLKEFEIVKSVPIEVEIAFQNIRGVCTKRDLGKFKFSSSYWKCIDNDSTLIIIYVEK